MKKLIDKVQDERVLVDLNKQKKIITFEHIVHCTHSYYLEVFHKALKWVIGNPDGELVLPNSINKAANN